MLEKDIERYLFDEVRKHGGKAYKFNSGVRGMPDRLVLFPYGWMFFVELKAPGKKPRPLQEKRMQELRKMHYRTLVIDSKEKVDSLTKLIEEQELW